eukprot:517431_1
MGDLYLRAIPLSNRCKDAKKLKQYKNPKHAGIQVGDFTNCLYSVLQPRCIGKGIKTIFDVNNDLNNLQTECTNQKLKIRWFQRLMTSYTANEQKWLMRIILKDLKCGVRHESCLKNFHPNALETYNQTSSLLKVCQVISNPELLIAGGKCLRIELFHPIKPMLASRRHWNQVINVMNGPFGIEIKFDGERVMIHYRRSENRVMFWSRNSIDLEKKYGYVCAFGEQIKSQFICDSCILDGEMMSYDEDLCSFIPFGSNRTVVQNTDINIKQHLCYIAFDILMINGEIIMDLTLSRRRELLKDTFTQKKSYFEMTKMITGIENTKGIMEALDKALQDHHEGILVKSLNSIYECNKRGNEWIKLKPDYVDDMISSLDLLILGGYFGEGKRRVGDISHFLLGCRTNPFYKQNESNSNSKQEIDHDNDDDDMQQELPTEFYSFCKVGSGYKIEELKQLQNHLRSRWKLFKRSEINTSPDLKHFLGWRPQPDDVPDVYIEPKHSIIVELLANEIVICKNDKFHAGLTVRFPRCKRFRYDKPWYECISLKEIQDKFKYKSNHHHTRTAAEIALMDEQPKKKRKINRQRNAPSIMDKFRPADVTNIEIISDIFDGKEFCVLNGMEMMDNVMDQDDNDHDLRRFDKQELEKLIASHSGIFVQNPLTLSTNYLIAEKITPRVNNIIKSNTSIFNIIRPIWLIESVKNKRILPLSPTYMIYSTKTTTNKLKQKFDKYGDHFERPTTIDNLYQVFKKIKVNKNELNNDNNNWLKKEWNISDDEEDMLIGGWNRFKKCIIYIDYYDPININNENEYKCKFKWSSSLRLIEKRLQLYGAKISKYLNCNVTHIIVDNNDKERPRLKSINERITQMMNDKNYKWRPYLITKQWVEDSIRGQNVITDYTKYAPRKLSFPQR